MRYNTSGTAIDAEWSQAVVIVLFCFPKGGGEHVFWLYIWHPALSKEGLMTLASNGLSCFRLDFINLDGRASKSQTERRFSPSQSQVQNNHALTLTVMCADDSLK